MSPSANLAISCELLMKPIQFINSTHTRAYSHWGLQVLTGLVHSHGGLQVQYLQGLFIHTGAYRYLQILFIHTGHTGTYIACSFTLGLTGTFKACSFTLGLTGTYIACSFTRGLTLYRYLHGLFTYTGAYRYLLYE